MRMISNATSHGVRAGCGHMTQVMVPPHGWGSRPGPVGQQRIAEAQGKDCWICVAFGPVKDVCDGCGEAIRPDRQMEIDLESGAKFHVGISRCRDQYGARAAKVIAANHAGDER